MPRAVLCPVTRDDAAELIRGHLESRAHHIPWVWPFIDQDGFDAWYDALDPHTTCAFVARESGAGAIIGVITLSQIARKDFQSAYLGYYGMQRFSRQGLMTEAIRLATRHAFDTLGLHRLEANIQPANLASIALVRRLGFLREGFSPRYLRINGVWCDHERWALLADAADPSRSLRESG